MCGLALTYAMFTWCCVPVLLNVVVDVLGGACFRKDGAEGRMKQAGWGFK